MDSSSALRITTGELVWWIYSYISDSEQKEQLEVTATSFKTWLQLLDRFVLTHKPSFSLSLEDQLFLDSFSMTAFFCYWKSVSSFLKHVASALASFLMQQVGYLRRYLPKIDVASSSCRLLCYQLIRDDRKSLNLCPTFSDVAISMNKVNPPVKSVCTGLLVHTWLECRRTGEQYTSGNEESSDLGKQGTLKPHLDLFFGRVRVDCCLIKFKIAFTFQTSFKRQKKGNR